MAKKVGNTRWRLLVGSGGDLPGCYKVCANLCAHMKTDNDMADNAARRVTRTVHPYRDTDLVRATLPFHVGISAACRHTRYNTDVAFPHH